MKKILFVGLLLPYTLFGFDPYLCATYIGHSAYEAKPSDNCVIDSDLNKWIKCRAYFKKNMLKGLSYHGEKEVATDPMFYYTYFNNRIKEVLLAEVKNVINRHQSIMGIENTEASLLKYQESIAEHEWCYAPKFLKSFNDKSMNEHEMKSRHFISLYNTRSNMLVSKEKPKNKKILCGVYLEYMSSFIHAKHTEVSSELSALYEKTKKECFPNYFIIETSINVKMNKKIVMRKHKAGTRDVARKGSFNSKSIFYINPERNSIDLRKLENDISQQNTKNIRQEHFLGDKSYNVDIKHVKPRKGPRINITASIVGEKDKKIRITARPVKYPTKYTFTIDLDTLLKSGEYKDSTASDKGAYKTVLPKSLMQHIGMGVQTGASGSCSIYIHRADKADVEEFKLYDTDE